MTPKEKVNHDLWRLMSKIQEEQLLNQGSEKTIDFSPESERELKLLKKLHELGAIQLQEKLNAPMMTATGGEQYSDPSYRYSIIINKKTFDEFYAEYAPTKSSEETNDQQKESGGKVAPKTLIIKDARGDYYYDGKQIKMSRKKQYYFVFDILYSHCDQNGFLSYESFERYLTSTANDQRALEKAPSKTKRNQRITGAVSKQNGFFRYASVNGNRLENGTPDGKELIEVIRGEGLKLNNPSLQSG